VHQAQLNGRSASALDLRSENQKENEGDLDEQGKEKKSLKQCVMYFCQV